ncbi:hypothetical protein ACTD5D_19250 [Nocardia takedensis]|uniref:hypothetical protein n=1 Tax=Nocardia takedensis TaxID=259390 RepID=UPI003F75B9FF
MDEHRLSEPGFQLVWPRALFAEQVARLLNERGVVRRFEWDCYAEALLDHAFVAGYTDGPLAEFKALPSAGAFGNSLATAISSVAEASGKVPPLTPQQQYLRDLLRFQDRLHEDPPPRRPYYGEKINPAPAPGRLAFEEVALEFVGLVRDLEESGFFDKRFGIWCIDHSDREPGPLWVIHRALSPEFELSWPLVAEELAADPENFLSLIEVLHDNAARPRVVEFTHSEWEDRCNHYTDYDVGTGRAVYRWRLNKVLDRSDLGHRLAEEGEDLGRLVTLSDEGRTDLLHALAQRRGDDPEADEIFDAIAMFRARGASRQQKQLALAGLYRVLEQRRGNVIQDQMTKKDSGALFDIANNFHIRHGDGSRIQHKDYDDYYLDWVFWLYLSTAELTSRVLDDQARVAVRNHTKPQPSTTPGG